jgi:thiol:disulfide interchange protein
LRAGGEQIGWGFQLQSPLFVSLLAALFTLMGLNLAGLFEFGSVLPSGLAAMRARSPVVDHALTGVLAVAVASPCTGPFMGAALGAALTLPASQALSVFAVLGLGMGLPYLSACLVPALARRLPKPGAWMGRLKVLMSFPMFATVVWLVWVLGQQAGIDGVAGLLAVLVALGFIAWAWASPGFGRTERLSYRVVSLAVLAFALVLAAPHLQPAALAVASTTESSAWKPWSQSAVSEAQAQGRTAFVDFTAAWCVSCQVNKLTTLSKADVLADFKRRDVLLLEADWTRRDPVITQELTRLGRSGVPVYALYRPGGAGPVLLPEILSSDDIHRALSDIPLARASELTSIISTRSP